jgi:hypothetical protein
MPDCVIEHFPIIGVGDVPHALHAWVSTHPSPRRVVTQRLGDSAADVAAVVEFSLRAWAPVFESFRAVLGERVYQALYPDWSTTQARAVEAICQDDTAAV